MPNFAHMRKYCTSNFEWRNYLRGGKKTLQRGSILRTIRAKILMHESVMKVTVSPYRAPVLMSGEQIPVQHINLQHHLANMRLLDDNR